MATTVLPPPVKSRTTRRPPWRSPDGQPSYARPALLVITAFSVVLYAWGIEHSQFHSFYANAVRSMTESWKGFFFGSFDPGNSITLDKLPGFLWPQALSARVFGFHPWALTLPQVIEGVASVPVLFRVVRRWAGANAALIACVAFLTTPVAAGLFRTAVEDPAFTLCLLLAADATGRAAERGRLRPLLMAGVWVGLGFQAKMLEAWAVLPALAVVHLLSAPIPRRRRLAHVGLAGLVMVAVSASWVLAVTLTPAKDRPYVDGTTDNSALSMVVGYNFLNRFSSLGISAASTGSVSATQGGGGHRAGGTARQGAGDGGAAVTGGGFGGFGDAGAEARGGGGGGGAGRRTTHAGGAGAVRARTGAATGAGTGAGAGAGQAGPAAGRFGGGGRGGGFGGFGGGQGWSKMFSASLTSQTGWLYPFAAIALVCGLLWRGRRPRTDRLRAGFLLWGIWLVTYFLVFSAGSVDGHTYYMGVVAVPLAALTGAGATAMWRAHRSGGRSAWALPGAVAATVAWGAYICLQFTSFAPWLAPVMITLGAVGVVLLVLGRFGSRLGRLRRVAVTGLLTGLAAMLLAPSAWAVQVFAPSSGGMTSMMGAVGPTTPGAQGGRRGQGMPWTQMAGGARNALGAPAQKDRTPGAPSSRTESMRGARQGGGMAGFRGMDSGRLTQAQRQLLDYATARKGKAEYVFATLSWSAASPYILDTGAHVLPLGGFTGQVPFPTLAEFQRMTGTGQLRYVMLDSGGGRGGFGGMGAFFGAAAGRNGTVSGISAWVSSKCVTVHDVPSLYDCAPRH